MAKSIPNKLQNLSDDKKKKTNNPGACDDFLLQIYNHTMVTLNIYLKRGASGDAQVQCGSAMLAIIHVLHEIFKKVCKSSKSHAKLNSGMKTISSVQYVDIKMHTYSILYDFQLTY